MCTVLFEAQVLAQITSQVDGAAMSVQLQHWRRKRAAGAAHRRIFVSSVSVAMSLFRFKQQFPFCFVAGGG